MLSSVSTELSLGVNCSGALKVFLLIFICNDMTRHCSGLMMSLCNDMMGMNVTCILLLYTNYFWLNLKFHNSSKLYLFNGNQPSELQAAGNDPESLQSDPSLFSSVKC